jgi:glycosyltransferase involved in cell wall biosynthesis
MEMILFPVVGHGWRGYLRNFRRLRKLILKEKPDVVHAHYSTCGYLAALAAMGQKTKKVVSILGSFPTESRKLKFVRFCIDHVWHATIVKSERTRAQLDRNLPVIPNGVDLDLFPLIPQEEARRKVDFAGGQKYVIFVCDPSRPEKQFGLAQAAVERLDDKAVHLVPVFNKPHKEVVDYMCAADVLIMTSSNEGSPNVIKEAMACNCPIVVTDVGDVRWVTDGVDGTYVSRSSTPEDLGCLLMKALAFGGRTCGRDRIQELGLTSDRVAHRIMNIYSA